MLTGERARLRPFTVDDAEAVADACQDAEIHRWTVTIPWPYTEAHARAWIETHAARRRTGSGHHFAFVDAATNEFGGSISLERRAAEPGSAGVGYWTAAPARRRGYATEALGLVVGFAFDRSDIDRIILVTMVGNESRRGWRPAAASRWWAPTTPIPTAPGRAGAIPPASGSSGAK